VLSRRVIPSRRRSIGAVDELLECQIWLAVCPSCIHSSSCGVAATGCSQSKTGEPYKLRRAQGRVAGRTRDQAGCPAGQMKGWHAAREAAQGRLLPSSSPLGFAPSPSNRPSNRAATGPCRAVWLVLVLVLVLAKGGNGKKEMGMGKSVLRTKQ